MVATAADIVTRKSNSAAVAGDAATGGNNLGKFMSQTGASSGTNAEFDTITQSQNLAGQVDYRCVFLANLSTTDFVRACKVWMTNVSGGANAAIGLDPTGVVDMNSVTPQALTIANDATAPAGVVFSSPANFAAGLVVGDLGPRKCFAVWVRRTATASGAVSADGVDINISGTVP
jgi:hypothetical protein